jgi:hypothetical protein
MTTVHQLTIKGCFNVKYSHESEGIKVSIPGYSEYLCDEDDELHDILRLKQLKLTYAKHIKQSQLSWQP